MTDKEIMVAVQSFDFERCGIENGAVWFLQEFQTDDQHEPTDTSWDLYCSLSDRLAEMGLMIEDMGSDNDSLWGKIVNKA